jgi:hypothetical protein
MAMDSIGFGTDIPGQIQAQGIEYRMPPRW